jgi:hypothetical protein
VLRVGDLTLPEGDTGTSTGYLTVVLSAPSTSPVTASFTRSAGSADAADFVPGSGSLSIPAGATSATIPVVIRSDALDEPTQRFSVVLSAPSGGHAGGRLGQRVDPGR